MTSARVGPGGAVLHLAPVLAIMVLALNDHWWKDAWPGLVTGKLSDVAGLAFFPLLLVAFAEVALAVAGRYRAPSDRLLVAAIGATAMVFALAKTTTSGNEAYGVVLGALQQPWAPIAAPPVVLVRDAGDLVALVALLVPWVVGRAAARGAPRGGASP